MLVVGGYPEAYEKGKEISGLTAVEGSIVFHAGTKVENGRLCTSGGRVLNVIGFGESLEEAIESAYDKVDSIKYNGKYYRKDIGKKGLNYLERNNNVC